MGNNETTPKQRPHFLLGEFTKARESQINETSRRGVVLLLLSFTTPFLCRRSREAPAANQRHCRDDVGPNNDPCGYLTPK